MRSIAPPRRRRRAAPRLVARGGAAGALAMAAVALLVLWPTASSPAATRSARVVTGDAGSRLAFGDAVIDVEPDTALVASGDEATGVTVVLERGGAWFEVAPRAGRPAFAVHAGATRVEVIGTRFRVARDGEHAVVEVSHGVVRVHDGGAAHELRAGQRLGADGQLAGGGAAAGDAIATGPTQDPVTPADDDDPATTEADADAIELDPAPAPAPARDRRVLPDRRTGAGDRAPARDTTATQTPVDDAAARFEQASRLEARDARAALAIYQELSRRTDGWGATALFARARLEHDLGDRAAARRDLLRYLARFPRGLNADDARRLLAGLGD